MTKLQTHSQDPFCKDFSTISSNLNSTINIKLTIYYLRYIMNKAFSIFKLLKLKKLNIISALLILFVGVNNNVFG